MPKFETLSLDDAKKRTGSSAAEVDAYLGYVRSLGPNSAGHLTLIAGESMRAVKLRLTRASKAAGLVLTVRQVGEDQLYFWPSEPLKPRRGRKPKALQP